MGVEGLYRGASPGRRGGDIPAMSPAGGDRPPVARMGGAHRSPEGGAVAAPGQGPRRKFEKKNYI